MSGVDWWFVIGLCSCHTVVVDVTVFAVEWAAEFAVECAGASAVEQTAEFAVELHLLHLLHWRWHLLLDVMYRLHGLGLKCLPWTMLLLHFNRLLCQYWLCKSGCGPKCVADSLVE